MSAGGEAGQGHRQCVHYMQYLCACSLCSSGEDSPRPCNISGSFRDGEGPEHRVEVPHDVVHGVSAQIWTNAHSLPVFGSWWQMQLAVRSAILLQSLHSLQLRHIRHSMIVSLKIKQHSMHGCRHSRTSLAALIVCACRSHPESRQDVSHRPWARQSETQ